MRSGHPADSPPSVGRWLLRLGQALVRWLLSGWAPPASLARVPALRPWLPAPRPPAVQGPAPAGELPAGAGFRAGAGAHDAGTEGQGASEAPEPNPAGTRPPASRRAAPPSEPIPCVEAFPWPFPAAAAIGRSDAPGAHARADVRDCHPSTWADGGTTAVEREGDERRPLPTGARVDGSPTADSPDAVDGDGEKGTVDPVLARIQAAVTALADAPPPVAWAVSVVLVARAATSAGRAIASVVAQSYPAWELLVVLTDDAPPPAIGGDPRVRVLSAPGADAAAARDRGVAAATGLLVAHLLEGERMAPTWLAAVVATLADAPAADIVVGERLAVGSAGTLPADLILAGRAGRVSVMPATDEDLSRAAHRREAYPVGGGRQLAGAAVRRSAVPAVLEPLLDLRSPEPVELREPVGSR